MIIYQWLFCINAIYFLIAYVLNVEMISEAYSVASTMVSIMMKMFVSLSSFLTQSVNVK